MPTYDYKCEKCGKTFEHFQSMSDKLLKTCPDCKGKVRRLISGGAGVIFKGTGFYQTDYKKSCPSDGQAKKSAPKKDGGCSGCPGACGH